jgi:hypothetical protein
MPELPIVTPGEIITSDHINDIADRTIQRYANQSDLDAASPSPVVGELAYLEDSDNIMVWTGGAWLAFASNVFASSVGINIDPATSPRLNVKANSGDVAARFYRNTPTTGATVVEVSSVIGESVFNVDAEGKVLTRSLGVGVAPGTNPPFQVVTPDGTKAANIHVDTSNVGAVVLDVSSAVGTQRWLVRADGDNYNINGVYGTISDERLKENIIPAPSYLDRLLGVDIMNFNMIDGDGTKLLGAGAQQVQQVLPGVVTENEEGMLAIKSTVFIPMLIQAIQELTSRIETLEE